MRDEDVTRPLLFEWLTIWLVVGPNRSVQPFMAGAENEFGFDSAFLTTYTTENFPLES